MTIGSARPSKISLARRLARASLAVELNRFGPDVVAATPDEIRSRFRKAAADAVGTERALGLEQLIEACESLSDASAIPAHCRLEPIDQRLRSAS